MDNWQTTKSAGIPCAGCGKEDSCTVSPDGKRFKCWREDGKVIDAPTDPRLAKADKPKKSNRSYDTLNEAIAAYGLNAQPSKVWTYRSPAGVPLMAVARFDLNDGKQYRPVHTHKGKWRAGDPDGKLPLYNLADLAAADVVVITEGERCADRANEIGYTSTTSSHGSSSPEKTDWSPLANKTVVILPDNDVPGEKYAAAVAGILGKLRARVKIVRLPELTEGEDVVEFSDRHADARQRIDQLIAAAPEQPRAGAVLTCLADVQPRKIDWLWQNRIPMGRLSLLVGKPGEGKSFATVDVAARISTGSPWPDGEHCERGSTLLIAGEDDAGDTIRPRLDGAMADVSRVHLLQAVRRVNDAGEASELLFTLHDLPAVEDALDSIPDCRLVVIDPIGSFLGGKLDINSENEVRGVLTPLAKMAERRNVAVLMVAHRRKATGGSADDLAMGSRAFTGIARSVWHLCRCAEDRARRLLLPGKNNLAVEGTGLAFTIGGQPPSIRWDKEPVTITADDAVAEESRPGPDPEAREEAKEWLEDQLKGGPVEAKEIEQKAKAARIAPRTLRRASDELDVIKERSQFNRKFMWRLKDGTVSPRRFAEALADVAPNN